jgi:hypothetical protein
MALGILHPGHYRKFQPERKPRRHQQSQAPTLKLLRSRWDYRTRDMGRQSPLGAHTCAVGDQESEDPHLDRARTGRALDSQLVKIGQGERHVGVQGKRLVV